MVHWDGPLPAALAAAPEAATMATDASAAIATDAARRPWRRSKDVHVCLLTYDAHARWERACAGKRMRAVGARSDKAVSS